MARNRELTKGELRSIRHMATTLCANYDKHYCECALLEGCCYMTTICFTNSGLCKYFENAVLPLNPKLESVFKRYDTKPCRICGTLFKVNGRQAYCSEKCRGIGTRKLTAERTKKYRDTLR